MAAMTVNGVRDVQLEEDIGNMSVDVHVKIDPHADWDYVADEVNARVDAERPMGIKMNVHMHRWEEDTDYFDKYEVKVEETEEERFMKRLRSKILERYPPEEE